MANYRIPGFICGSRQPWPVEDGTLARWAMPSIGPVCASSSLYESGDLMSAAPPTTAPDVGFIFVQCLNPKRGLSATDYVLQYRFGSTGRTELSFPEDPSAGASSFLFAHYFRFQTDRTEVSFRNKAVDYAIFDYTEDRKRRAGVRVTTADGKETELVCSGAVASRLPELKNVLRCDADNALNGGNCR